MKLSQLIRLKKELNTVIDTKPVIAALDYLISEITKVSKFDIPTEFEQDVLSVAAEFDKIKQEINGPVDTHVSKIIHDVDHEVADITKDYFARGYSIVEGHIATNFTNPDHERKYRKLPLSEETRDMVTKKIYIYSDWHYPGLEIGPGDGDWTEHLVGNDPLYLFDQYPEYLENTKSRFPPEYQRRLRTYQQSIEEGRDTDLSVLPDNQFGFIFSWNVFNYFPLDHVKRYLTECFRVLRPGGVMMFSYNNGENPVCAEFVEQGFMSYMPKTLLISLIEHLGFELVAAHDRDDFVHWVEIRKPGFTETVKAHQAMGEIIHRSA